MTPGELRLPEGTPKNLFELMESNQIGYQLQIAYCLELKHTRDRFLPARYKGTTHVVVTVDRAVLQEVWKTMSFRESNVVETTFYVNERKGVGYPMLGHSKYDREDSKPMILLTREIFTQLMASDPNPFEWTLDTSTCGMTQAEFGKKIEEGARRCGL